MKPRRLRLLLGAGLVVTLVAAWFAPPPKDETLMLSERAKNTPLATVDAQSTRNPPGRMASKSSLEVLNIRPRTTEIEDDAEGGRLFASSQWAGSNKQVPVNAVADLPPPPPQAPPLPFLFLGRYEDAGQSAIFLQYNAQNLVVRQGDTLGEQYKVEKLDRTTLNLRYLPLNQVQSLDVGPSR